MRDGGAVKGRSVSWMVVKILALGSVVMGMVALYGGLWGVGGRVDIWTGGGVFRGGEVDTGGVVDAIGDGEEPSASEEGNTLHPIEQLMTAGEKEFVLKISEQATSLADAARKYRSRRGRHPPPGFDKWYAYAVKHDAVIVESFFNQIYDDLGPFWGVDVYDLRRMVQTFSPKISIRNGIVDSKVKKSYERLNGMVDMLVELLATEGVDIPDMDIPFNVNEEVGMLVEWEELVTAKELARPMLTTLDQVVEDFAPISDKEYASQRFDPGWLDGRLRHSTQTGNYGPRPFWSLVRPACPPASPTRKEALWADIWHEQGHTDKKHSAAALLPLEAPRETFHGYVRSWEIGRDLCLWPRLQGLHGTIVAPEEMSITKKLFPFFSASKIRVSKEVLVPSSASWNRSAVVSPTSWDEKMDQLFWRGPATGGENSMLNWRRFHRHRFVAMLNATHVEIAEGLLHAGNESMVGLGYARNFRLLPGNDFALLTQRNGRTAAWVNSWADAAFTDLHCNVASEGDGCAYTDEYFSVAAPHNSSSELGRSYKFAAILDDNGGDDQGDFVDALEAGRVALKASIYKQWFDGRVVPWVHFVPLDNTFVDLYGVMEFFLGTTTKEAAAEFSHAHVDLPKHGHHFQSPDADNEQDADHDAQHNGEYDQKQDKNLAREDRKRDGNDDAVRKIAEAGQVWAAKVLRKEDMSVYMYRLLLEYGRVVDTRRKRLGWVGDLRSSEVK